MTIEAVNQNVLQLIVKLVNK